MATQCTSAAADVEILVHVTAPSKVADDVAYRHLAQAYLSFAPGSRANVTIPSSPLVQQQPPPSRQDQPDDGHNSAALLSFCSDSQDASFRSVLDNRSSPLVSSKMTRQPATPPVHQLPSQIPDSYPMPDADLFNVTPTRVLQRYMGNQLPGSSPIAQRRDIVSSPPLSGHHGIETQIAPNEIGTNLPVAAAPAAVNVPSYVPSSQSRQPEEQRLRREATIPVTPTVPGTTRKRKADDMIEHLDDACALDMTHVSSSINSTSSSAAVAVLQRSESDPLPPKRLRKKNAKDGADAHHNLVRSVSDPNNQHQRRCQQQQLPPPPSSSPLAYASLSQVPSTYLPSASSSPASSFISSLSIRPPSPPASVANLALPNLVSAKLAKLAQDLSSRYRPILHRALDPLERGYWLVDCTTWPTDTRTDAWAFLKSYVGSGLAGWGVWCKRSGGGSCGDSWGDGKQVCIRLYGWAHVVKHTYLLLYLVSGRQLKTTGAKWYDADGEVAVEVVP